MRIFIQIKQQVLDHPYMATFFALVSGLIRFFFESLAVDGIAYLFLFAMYGFDTYTGVKQAKQSGEYDYKILKEKTAKKVQGQLIILICTGVFTMILFILNFLAGEKGINYYLLNIPMLTTILFYAGVEFLSIKDNVRKTFGVIAPASVVERVEKLVSTGGKEAEKLLNQN